MAERRLLGIDLGITTAHTAAILDQAGQVLGRRRSTKPRGGKAPQHVLSGHTQTGTSRAEPGRPSPRPILGPGHGTVNR